MALKIFNNVFRRKHRLLFALNQSTATSTEINKIQENEEEEFRVLELYPTKKKRTDKRTGFFQPPILPPREKSMPIDQDWPSVWPAQKSFRPSSVPLPVYQGFIKKGVPPGKYANAELMKIPNFLHLTPPAIERQCNAIKKFCTRWPEGLENEEDYDRHFPLEVITTTYCHSSPTIRDERARVVTFKLKLASLNLDYHGKDKMLRLIGEERYNKKTDLMILVADRCPVSKQNYDYLMYLLSALYHESMKVEPWESEKTEDDMEKFFFEDSRCEKHAVIMSNAIRVALGKQELQFDELKSSPEIVEYGDSLTKLLNEGETKENMQKYKESVANILGFTLPVEEPDKVEDPIYCDPSLYTDCIVTDLRYIHKKKKGHHWC